MLDQANEAIDPMKQAMNLIANSDEESDPPEDDEEQIDPPEDDGEEVDPDADEEGATEPPKREVLFAGQKFAIPEDTPPEVAAQIEETGKAMQADYTRKTQELVSRERQAAEIVQNELNQGRQQLSQAVQQVQAVLQTVGGLMSPAELAQLAATDPQGWIQANARQQQITSMLGQLQQQAQLVDQQTKQADAHRQEVAKQEAWQRLNAEGIDNAGLQKLWVSAKQHYGLSDERLAQVLDAESWLVLRDAIAMRELKAQKPAITKKVNEAPRLPEGKKPMSKDDRARLDARKAVQRKGGAGMRDLAAFITTNTR